jgi:hypothetical protein
VKVKSTIAFYERGQGLLSPLFKEKGGVDISSTEEDGIVRIVKDGHEFYVNMFELRCALRAVEITWKK